MKYKVIRNCMISGKSHVIGDIVELDDVLSSNLMSINRVEPYDEKVELDNRAVGLDASEEAPKRRGRPPKVTTEGE